jgi:3-hydroxybutyryl-CoA dehydrogenase
MSRDPNLTSTVKLPDELAYELKKRELLARTRTRKLGIFGASPAGRSLALRMAGRGITVTLVAGPTVEVKKLQKELSQQLEARGPAGHLDPDGLLRRIQLTPRADHLRGQELVFDTSDLLVHSTREHDEVLRTLDATIEPDVPIAVVVPDLKRALTLQSNGLDGQRIVPVHVPLAEYDVTAIEVIRTPWANRDAVVKARRFLDCTGIPILRAPGVPGLIVDRLLLSVIFEAARLLQEGQSEIESIDQTFRISPLHNLGPLQLADLIGLDVIVDLGRTLERLTSNPRYRPPRLLQAYVERGYLGRKSGRGFYLYEL